MTALALNNMATSFAITPPAELMPQLMANFEGSDTFGSSVFRSISLRGFQFTLKDGNNSTVWPEQFLPVVILGMAPDQHCTWYKTDYDANATTTIKPDAVWYRKQGAPANVPASVIDGKKSDGSKLYQTQHRIVVALIKKDANDQMIIDLENPYVLDVGAMSIFGDDYPDQNAYSFRGLNQYAKRNKVLLLHFITKIIFDRSKSVPSIRFQPQINNGYPVYLSNEYLEGIYKAAVSSDVVSMLKVRLIPEPGAELAQAAPSAPQQSAPALAPAPVQQPVPQPAPVQQPVAQPSPVPTATNTISVGSPNELTQMCDDASKLLDKATAAATSAQSMMSPTTGSDTQSALNDLLQAAGSYGG